ncbi:class I SAM-dependent methyltransferase [Winogradskyella sp. A3E31]|uniref:class I SAM-dependent methyltransferase n=1 Tax=Winogradskyella sp. A3E31 TaxID=3349637 RepID=UPI00398B3DD8
MSLGKKDIHVSDTAFVTCGFRRLNEKLSQDIYAKLWRNDKAELLLKDYTKHVSTEEIETHCIRNRYFLESLRLLIEKNQIETLINFGAGFSMYPYLLDGHITHIEIDKPEVVDYKSSVTKEWIKEGVLPHRNIDYIGVDFSTDYQNSVLNKIQNIQKDTSCFILIEGVLFFLNRKETESIFDFFDTIQSQGDFIGSVSYTDEILGTRAYDRLIDYASKGLDDASEGGLQCIENSFYEGLDHYKLIDHQDYFSCSKQFNHSPKSDPTDILNEHFYILQKK